MLRLSSDSSGTESLSWIANSMDWDYESDETDPETIFSGPKDSVDTMGLVRHNNKDTISDAESVIRNVSVNEDQGVVSNDEMGSQGKMFYGGIWWNSTWVEDMDLYDDHEYWRCEDDTIMEEEEDWRRRIQKKTPRKRILKKIRRNESIRGKHQQGIARMKASLIQTPLHEKGFST